MTNVISPENYNKGVTVSPNGGVHRDLDIVLNDPKFIEVMDKIHGCKSKSTESSVSDVFLSLDKIHKEYIETRI